MQSFSDLNRSLHAGLDDFLNVLKLNPSRYAQFAAIRVGYQRNRHRLKKALYYLETHCPAMWLITQVTGFQDFRQ